MVGWLQWHRSFSQIGAYNDAGATASADAIADSNVTKAYKMMGVLLLPFGSVGLITYIAGYFVKSAMIYMAKLYIGMATPIVGLILLVLSLYKSITRPKCSEDAYW